MPCSSFLEQKMESYRSQKTCFWNKTRTEIILSQSPWVFTLLKYLLIWGEDSRILNTVGAVPLNACIYLVKFLKFSGQSTQKIIDVKEFQHIENNHTGVFSVCSSLFLQINYRLNTEKWKSLLEVISKISIIPKP